ncbi:4-hydroxy-tetrahydrodipicolinate synthase [Marinobacter sp. M3C]|uniref:4-hydroxy-tetrahydrodipicolinate synthase n=1 Tax=unclassified Marinobacter TaxID=83889 RepID=UPI00200FC181|nr:MULTISPECIES: 4-hydroxy-tetrahydrodipicolinate synthase [unclassified Marinobacter]MCL1479217.1 4-hydroxy-tetrahydrodipicolinate synthase [Marinobacter sp.]MCL1481369.1 4-hydroxy-tetrahydrodipicolinate synthase [Marinobacter sp.]UQG54210.1 4-hydroxy-tetrahydrodipicolinate synthase [Marinobacter sp. M4C]UQG60381.1 4-hydroxy-tetrahydrodipicolinate synthase [Marinobacter sp. M3C]UQG63017.1 4-hydroxy-tetrahydrodipicolinate synthase [Marinobacter sp. M2C]
MITGSLVALVTPMHPNGDIHWEHLDKLVDFHIENGTHGIVAVGTTGESATLDPEEHCKTIGHIIKRVNGRIPVIAGTGGNSTREAIALTSAAHKLGADACLLVVPYYNKPTQEGLYQHFRTIAEAVPMMKQMLYNVPGRTACDMLNETVVRLADIPNIIAIKDATGNIPRGAELIQAVKGRLDVYSGDDATAMELMLAGAKGNVSVTANVAPRAMADLCTAAVAGSREEAERLNELLMPLNRKLFLEANPIPVKWALQRMGMIGDGLRLPLTVLSEQFHGEVEEALKASGVL